jgi:hypothetical protein
MLTAEQKKTVAALLKVKLEDFESALTSTEEVALTIPEGIATLLPDDLTRVKNEEYGRGKTTGVEMAVKEAKEKMGIDFSGKSIDGLIEAANKKALADAKITPDAKVAELQKDMATLRTTNESLTQQIATKDAERESALTDREIFRALPSLGENAPAIDKVIKLMRADGYDFKIQDGKLVPVKGGEIMKDATANVLDPKGVIMEYAKAEKLIAEGAAGGSGDPKGRGEGDGGKTPVFSKLSELTKHYESQGKNTLGQEFSAKVQELVKANPEFDMNS